MKKIILTALLVPAIALAQTFPSPTFNSVTLQNPLATSGGGTGVANTNTITLGGNLTTSGANPLVFTTTGSTSVTLPTSGTLLSTGTSTGSGAAVLATSPTISNPIITGSFTATGLVTPADHATQAANTVLGNSTASSASPSALSVPICSATNDALAWTSGTGFACNTGLAPAANTTLTGITTLPVVSQTATGNFFGNLGARVSNLNDRFNIGAVTPFAGNQNQNPPDWTGSVYSVGGVPAFGYLEQNGTLNVSSVKGELPIVAAARASDSGTAGNATIGVSSAVINDNTFTPGGADTWNFYGTTVRGVGATGTSTLGMELEIVNLGAIEPIYPYNLFTNGLTSDLWLGVGGELANQTPGTYTFNNASAAITILGNNGGANPNVAFDKGIVFGANALNSNAIAIAFAEPQNMVWYNSSNQKVAVIGATATSATGALQLVFEPDGLNVVDGSGNEAFRVTNGVTGAANAVSVTPAVTGSSPIVAAEGTDTNINLTLNGKGTGTAVMPQNDVLTYQNTSAQSISNNSATILTGWTKSVDRLSANFNASTGVFSAPTTGFYHVNGGVVFAQAAGVVDSLYSVSVVANSATLCIGQIRAQTTASVPYSATVGCDVSLATGQTVDLTAFQNSGAALATAAGTFVSIHKLP